MADDDARVEAERHDLALTLWTTPGLTGHYRPAIEDCELLADRVQTTICEWLREADVAVQRAEVLQAQLADEIRLSVTLGVEKMRLEAVLEHAFTPEQYEREARLRAAAELRGIAAAFDDDGEVWKTLIDRAALLERLADG